MKPPLLVLVGPTAVGKTALSLQLAKAYNAEIISGDSMQVYRGMDIGTAKLPLEERQGVPHHLIDICEPEQSFSVSQFQELCTSRIQDIYARGKLPFIVGGTGLYIESVCYDFQFQDRAGDDAFRQACADYARTHGALALHEQLAAVDPVTATRLHPNDERRIIRALEVHHLTGKPYSEQQAQQRGDRKNSPYQLCIICLTMDRERLYERIEQRVDEMLSEGLAEEVRSLLEAGVPLDAVSMRGLGYKEIAAWLTGEIDYDEAVAQLKRGTRHFAKRQLSWFRHMDGLEWVNIDEAAKNTGLFTETCAIITGKFACDLEYNSS